MFEKVTKKDYVNEILRLTKSLCQMKHDTESDKQIKNLIQENFAKISEIEKEEQKKREIRKNRNFQNKLTACVGG